MFVTEHSNQTFLSLLFLVIDQLLEHILTVSRVCRFDQGVVLDLISVLTKINWMHVLAAKSLKDCRVNDGVCTHSSFIGSVGITDRVNMAEFLIEYLVHFWHVRLVFVDFEDRVSKLDGVSEARSA